MEYLCAHGADVNRGLRSSSLHYAGCFGRPQIVRVCRRLAFVQCCNVHCILYVYEYISFRRRIFILLKFTSIPCSSILLTFPANSPRNKLTSTYLFSLSLLTRAPTSTVVVIVFHVYVTSKVESYIKLTLYSTFLSNVNSRYL